MSAIFSSQAKVLMNVRIRIAKPQPDGAMEIVTERRYKNTATRLMTESICNYLTGAENTYKRGKGRPNYMGIGTMGIAKQPEALDESATVTDNFEDKRHAPGDSTRPWFESTSLALTEVCGAINPDPSGISYHFWDATLGWGKDGFTGEASQQPIFQGELCTSRIPNHDPEQGEVDDWDSIGRIPILRSDVLSDCPADWDYGVDGYCSQATFYGYASAEWVHKLLHPTKAILHPQTHKEIRRIPVGPQLDKMAISEFGLYEKNNTDPHGLETMLAGFRVPTEEDIVYIHDGEVILIEWRVSVRALMPYEGVTVVDEPAPTGISVYATVLEELPDGSHDIQMSGVVRGPIGVRQGITWSFDNPEELSPDTTLSADGLLHVDSQEQADVIYVNGASVVDPFIVSKAAILTGLVNNLITAVAMSTTSIQDFDIQFDATVLGKGTFSPDVVWSLEGAESPNTTISQSGLLHVDMEETGRSMKVTATSVGDSRIKSIAAVVRINMTAGSYVISDFTILT